MENDSKSAPQGRKTDAEGVCRHFERIPQSLIEEPEVCEWCEYYRDGMCFREEK